MEKFIYEMRPFFFMAGGIYAAAASHGDHLMAGSGFILILSSVSIIRARMKNRECLQPLNLKNYA
jgi:hypothetical protein